MVVKPAVNGSLVGTKPTLRPNRLMFAFGGKETSRPGTCRGVNFSVFSSTPLLPKCSPRAPPSERVVLAQAFVSKAVRNTSQ